jgi:hypothetical protein
VLYSLHSSSFLPQWRITPTVVHNFHTNFSLHSGLFPPQWLIPSTGLIPSLVNFSAKCEFDIKHDLREARGPWNSSPQTAFIQMAGALFPGNLPFIFVFPFLFSFVYFFHSATYYGLDMSVALSQTCHFLTSFILTLAIFRFLMPSCCKKLKMTRL